MMRWIALLLLAAVLPLGVACEEETEGIPTATAEVDTSDGAEAAEPTPSGASYSEDDVEYKLASIDAGEQLSLNDPTIRLYTRLLDELDVKCREKRSLIADQAVRATQLLADEGISATILEALRGINGSIPEDLGTVECAEIAAAWIVLTVNQ